MTIAIDHFMYGVSDLDLGLAWAAEQFDAVPVPGGAHPGLGSRNALLSLGTSYLEIIAPDPEQELTGTFGVTAGMPGLEVIIKTRAGEVFLTMTDETAGLRFG